VRLPGDLGVVVALMGVVHVLMPTTTPRSRREKAGREGNGRVNGGGTFMIVRFTP
jgi:hypothetical protein